MRIRTSAVGVAVASLLLTTVGVLPTHAAPGVTASSLPSLLRLATETTSPAYDRDRFEHWIDADGNGCNTRYEVLILQSATPVSKVPGASCTLSGGSWVSPYDNVTASTPADVQIDHVVALAEAWRSGASAWSDAQRRAFANDLGVPYALTVSSPASNQAKSDHDPATWLPMHSAYVCDYVIAWSLVKYRWSLAVDAGERAAITNVLSGDCGSTAVTLPAVALDPPTTTPEVTPPSTTIAEFPAGVTRLAGSDRYETAIQASKRYSSGVPVVFVATGENFPDALSAAAAAAVLGGPLLLTKKSSLPGAVKSELQRLKPKRIVLVGSTAAVSASVMKVLQTIAPTTRLGGADRYATGTRIVDHAFSSSTEAFIATGRTFPDALAATGAAGSVQAPVILVDGKKSSVSSAVIATLKKLGVTRVTIAGSAGGAVSSGIEKQLRNAGYSVQRLAGADRYATAAAINARYFPAGSVSTIFLATGENFPDALAGAAVAGRLGVPLFITKKSCVPGVIHSAITALGAPQRAVMGSTAAVSATAANNGKCGGGAAVAPPSSQVPGTVTPGAFCAKDKKGWIGYTATGKKMVCAMTPTDSALRWRAA